MKAWPSSVPRRNLAYLNITVSNFESSDIKFYIFIPRLTIVYASFSSRCHQQFRTHNHVHVLLAGSAVTSVPEVPVVEEIHHYSPNGEAHFQILNKSNKHSNRKIQTDASRWSNRVNSAWRFCTAANYSSTTATIRSGRWYWFFLTRCSSTSCSPISTAARTSPTESVRNRQRPGRTEQRRKWRTVAAREMGRGKPTNLELLAAETNDDQRRKIGQSVRLSTIGRETNCTGCNQWILRPRWRCSWFFDIDSNSSVNRTVVHELRDSLKIFPRESSRRSEFFFFHFALSRR